MSLTVNDEVSRLREHIASLPPVVQRAINSADTSELLQKLAKEHHLTLDKWSVLETGVTMVLVGALEPLELRDFLISEVNVSPEEVDPLLEKINAAIFDPIRKELERELEHPEAEEKKGTPIEDMTAEILANKERGLPADAPQPEVKPWEAAAHNPAAPQGGITPTASAPVPPSPTPTEQPPQGAIVRTSASDAYKPGQVSSERKDIAADPYREQP